MDLGLDSLETVNVWVKNNSSVNKLLSCPFQTIDSILVYFPVVQYTNMDWL